MMFLTEHGSHCGVRKTKILGISNIKVCLRMPFLFIPHFLPFKDQTSDFTFEKAYLNSKVSNFSSLEVHFNFFEFTLILKNARMYFGKYM